MTKFWKNMNPTWKRYIVSSLLTFFSGAAPIIAYGLHLGTDEIMKEGVVAGLIVTALRAGLKALYESTMTKPSVE